MLKIYALLVACATGLETPLSTYNFTWSVDSKKITLTLDVKTDGWIGFALSAGSGMRGADFVRIDGTGNIEDGYGLLANTIYSLNPPEKDCQQDWVLVSREVANGHTTAVIERPLDTGDLQDHVLKDDGIGNYLLVAHGAMGAKSYGYHGDNRAQLQVDFFRSSESHKAIIKALEADENVKQMHVRIHKDGDTSQPFTVPMPGNVNQVTNLIDKCMDLPDDIMSQGAHILAMQANVTKGNDGLVHHYVLYGMRQSCAELKCDVCQGVDTNPGSDVVTIWAWQTGGPDMIFPSDLGLPIGKGTNIKAIVLNVHYDNPEMKTGLTDSSATVIHYSFQKRKYDLGVLWVGDGQVSLGGQQVMIKDSAATKAMHQFVCPAERLKPLVGKINIIGSLQHMHRAGDWSETRLEDWKGNTKAIWTKELYDGNYQTADMFNTSLQLAEGDKIRMSCVWDNALKAANKDLLRFGTEGDEEMCMDFLYYYSEDNSVVAAENARSGVCEYEGQHENRKHWMKPIFDDREELHIKFGSPPKGMGFDCQPKAPEPEVGYKMYNVTTVVGNTTYDSSLSVGQLGPDNASMTVVALHGFPEGSRMWFPNFAPQILKRFGSSSARVVAPDMRGYNRTVPKYNCTDPGCEAYQPINIAAEIAMLLKTHFNATANPVHLVGHDWGAAIAWLVAILHPEVVKTLSVVSVAHPSVFLQYIIEEPRQAAASTYATHFMNSDVVATSMKPSITQNTLKDMGMLNKVDPDMEADYIDAWLYKDSFKYAMYYYRGSKAFQNIEQGINSSNMVLKIPVLQLWGADDGALLVDQVCCEKQIAEKLHVSVFPGTDHWVIDQRGVETADFVASLIEGKLDMDKCKAVAELCTKPVQAICDKKPGADSKKLPLPSTTCDVSAYPEKKKFEYEGTAADPSCDFCQGGGEWNGSASFMGEPYTCDNVKMHCQSNLEDCEGWHKQSCEDMSRGLSKSACCGWEKKDWHLCNVCAGLDMVPDFDEHWQTGEGKLESCTWIRDKGPSHPESCENLAAYFSTEGKDCCVKPKLTTQQPTEKVGKVRSTITVKNLDFDKVNSDKTLKDKVITQVKDAYLANLDKGYTKDHLEVTLSKGSIKAQVDITPISGSDPAKLETALQAKTADLQKTTLTKIKEMPDVKNILEDGKTVDDLTVEAKAPVKLDTSGNTVTNKPPESSTSASVALHSLRILMSFVPMIAVSWMAIW